MKFCEFNWRSTEKIWSFDSTELQGTQLQAVRAQGADSPFKIIIINVSPIKNRVRVRMLYLILLLYVVVACSSPFSRREKNKEKKNENFHYQTL